MEKRPGRAWDGWTRQRFTTLDPRLTLVAAMDDLSVVRGRIRWFSATERERGLARIEAIARGVGEALRVRIEFEVLGRAPVTSNVPEYAALVDEAVTVTAV